ncbi:TetR/AcrR family transcriptional regulator [Tepidicaulis sp. LMO-SS28]|uniref:TetR/AcrR family transcriptional regulator n=1 Tax=Tepidicaulis sp. LMO-SS28 TaxID=3447455 RepID=UPI003EE01562
MAAGQTATLSRRETAKAERRQRIVDAAGALVREQGYDAVSMVQIAERAEVSPATLYNLFQTKSAIFQRVFDLDLEDYQRKLADMPVRNALERLYAAIDLAAELCRNDPDFYRAMTRAGDSRNDGLGLAIGRPRRAFWRAEVETAIKEGYLRGETDADLLSRTLGRFMRSVFLEWSAHLIPAKQLQKEAAYGFTLALLPYSTRKSGPALKSRLADLEAALAAPCAKTKEKTSR